MSLRFVIVGGGIAGLTCAEELCRLRKKDVVTLVTVDAVLKVGELPVLVSSL